MRPNSRLVARLPTGGEVRAIGYSAGNLGKNLMWSSVDLTLLFVLTEIMGLRPAAAGLLMVVALAGDMVIDIFAGRISVFAARLGLGYRHVLLALAPACAAAFAALYAIAGHDTARAWPGGIAAALIAFRLFYGLIDVPHNAMLPHIARDSRSRGRVAGYRFFFSSLASLAVARLLAPLVGAAGVSGDASGIGRFGVVAGAVATLALWIAALSDRSPRPAARAATGRVPLFPRIGRDYARLLAIGLLAGAGSGMFARLVIYYGKYNLANPGAAADILSAVVIGQFLGVVLWPLATQRFDTARVVAMANLLSAACIAAFALLRPELRTLGGFLIGVSLAGIYSLPWALLADIIDAEDARSDDRREPQAVSLFLTMLKAGAALGMMITGWALAGADHAVAAGRHAAIAATVEGLMIVPPMLGGAIAAALAWRIGISHAAQAGLADLLARRNARKDA